MIFAAVAVIVVVLIVIISVSVHNAREDERLTAKIKANADAVTPFSDQVETAGVDSLIVFNEGGVKITLTGYKSNGVIGDEINYVLENSSYVPVMFGVGDAYVDGWKITTLGGNTLPSGTKTNGTIYLSREDLKQSGITTITSVTLKDCNIWNDESSEIMATFDIVVNVG